MCSSIHLSRALTLTVLIRGPGYPDYDQFGSNRLQTTTEEAGAVVLSLYCYMFIFFFLVMLVAIQHVAYNKVRGLS